MEWVQFIIFFLGVFGLWLWNRAESRADNRHMDAKLESHRKEMAELLKVISDDMKDFHGAMKDFHGRLCAIEERRTIILEGKP
jgi:hypothetical protein